MCHPIAPLRPEDFFKPLENPIPGGKVVTRLLRPGLYKTAVHGGQMNGDVYDYDNAVDATDGHYATVQNCRQADQDALRRKRRAEMDARMAAR